MLATVVIPTYGRSELLDRAIDSVIKSNGSELVEIMVVDDCSPVPSRPKILREHDVFVSLKENSGAAVARNYGIDNAKGKVIYLLDSDDYIVNRDFKLDFELYSNDLSLRFCNISSQEYISNFPGEIKFFDFFDFVFFKHPHICQTSSLFFNKELNLRFDETLPKHQDWDFVLFSCLLNDIPVKKATGEVFFDRSDRMSLSRKRSIVKSEVWFQKIIRSNFLTLEQLKYVEFFLLSESSGNFSGKLFFTLLVKYLYLGKLSFRKCLIKVYDRYIKT